MEKEKVIAVDFDLTLATYKEPWIHDKLGNPIESIIRAIKILKQLGYYIIIYTGRLETPTLTKWLNNNGVPYDSINRSLKDFPYSSKAKIYFGTLIDDKVINPINLKEKRYKTPQEMIDETKLLNLIRKEFKK